MPVELCQVGSVPPNIQEIIQDKSYIGQLLKASYPQMMSVLMIEPQVSVYHYTRVSYISILIMLLCFMVMQ